MYTIEIPVGAELEVLNKREASNGTQYLLCIWLTLEGALLVEALSVTLDDYGSQLEMFGWRNKYVLFSNIKSVLVRGVTPLQLCSSNLLLPSCNTTCMAFMGS